MAEPSADIIRRAQAGDPDALTQLVLTQQQYVYSIAMSVLKDPDDAADLTQEAFIRLFRALPQYNSESRFTTWLYRLVVNLGRDELRRRGRQVPVIAPVEDEELDPMSSVADDDRWSSPEQALDSRELSAEVRQALSQLEEHYRARTTLGVNVLPEDVAQAVLHFASDARSGKTTGNLLNVDGGVAIAYPR